MPTPISEEVAGAAINNAVDQGYANLFSGWMYAQNCAETVLQWRVFVQPAEIGSQISVYTFVAGQWVLEEFQIVAPSPPCLAASLALQYLQETVEITEYRLLRVTGSNLLESGISGLDIAFPATWEPGMTEYLTPATDVVGSILESSVVWALDVTDDGCGNTTWPTPTT